MSVHWKLLLCLALLFAAIASLVFPMGGLAELWRSDPKLLGVILTEVRLPRVLLGLLYGAMLGGSGAAIQALFANPLASPDITGTTGGAALGAVVAAYFAGFTGPLGLAVGGVTGAALALMLLLGLAGRHSDSATMLLAGIAISAIAGAATALALALAPSPFAFYEAYDWLMGSLVDRSLAQAGMVAAPVLATLLFLHSRSRAFDTLALGDVAAESMGYPVARLRREVVIATAIGVGMAVAVCGAVGFIGLVAPIFARRLVRAHPGRAILPAAIIGAMLLTLADVLVRFAPAGRQFPIGVITALLGAPFFLALVLKMRLEWRS
ncbi:MAG: FecCD family ABC transporter permease [Sphingomonadaceae bacterium]